MLTIKRVDLLLRLQQVQAGTTVNPIIEQSSCFVFRKGNVFSFNGEVACRMPSGLDPSIEGAVQAKPLVDVLSKQADEEVMLGEKDGRLTISGKGWRSQYLMEKDITLPYSSVDRPKEWKELPTDFAEGMELVETCTSLEEGSFVMSCVHLTEGWVEACNDLQIARFAFDSLPIEQHALIKKDSVKGMLGLGVTHVSESERFLHFKNPTKLIYSCRRYTDGFVEEYPDFGPIFEIKGKRITLPPGMTKAADCGQTFMDEHNDKNKKQLILTLKEGFAFVSAIGVSGNYTARMKVKYKGPEVMLTVPPKLLKEITDKYNEGQLSDDKLIISGGKFSYVSCLGKVEKE